MDPTAPTTVLTAGGYVVARRKIELSPKLTARIEWIGADKGDRVQKGQVLIWLDPRDVAPQVDQTKSSLAAAEARLAELLAGSRRQEIEGARAAMEQAQSDLTIAELNLRRMRQLFERELVARQVFDEAQNQYQVAQAKLKAGSERFGLVEAGPRPEQIEAARAQVREAQANVELALANLANTLIVAPTDGTILERLAEVGETVTPNVFM